MLHKSRQSSAIDIRSLGGVDCDIGHHRGVETTRETVIKKEIKKTIITVRQNLNKIFGETGQGYQIFQIDFQV